MKLSPTLDLIDFVPLRPLLLVFYLCPQPSCFLRTEGFVWQVTCYLESSVPQE